VKQEACKVYLKIIEGERKRDKVLEQQANNSASGDQKNGSNNLDASVAKEQIIEIERKIADAQMELHQLETNSDETQSDKSMKNDETEKPKEIMDIFMSSLVKSKAEELQKLSCLEEKIIEHLERISNNIGENVDSTILQDDEMEMLKSLMDRNVENRSEKSFEELKQDNNKLRQILHKLRSLESKIKVDTNGSEENAEIGDNQAAKGDSKIRNFNKNQRKGLLLLDDKLINQEDKDNEYEFTEDRYSKLKEKIQKNEIYRFISILEDKLERVSTDNEQVQKSNEEQDELDCDNYSSLLEKLRFLTTKYNAYLISEMKSIY
jgi:hypothetical protein